MGQLRKRGNVWWIRYYRNGRRFEESARTDKKEAARDLLRIREGDVAKGVPVSGIAEYGAHLILVALTNKDLLDRRVVDDSFVAEGDAPG